jgi:hypothetical protein
MRGRNYHGVEVHDLPCFSLDHGPEQYEVASQLDLAVDDIKFIVRSATMGDVARYRNLFAG